MTKGDIQMFIFFKCNKDIYKFLKNWGKRRNKSASQIAQIILYSTIIEHLKEEKENKQNNNNDNSIHGNSWKWQEP